MNADNRTIAAVEELDHAARCVDQARALRAADYEMSAVFTDSMADQAIGDAERFLAAVRTVLA